MCQTKLGCFKDFANAIYKYLDAFSVMKKIFHQSAFTLCLVDLLYLRNRTIH